MSEYERKYSLTAFKQTRKVEEAEEQNTSLNKERKRSIAKITRSSFQKIQEIGRSHSKDGENLFSSAPFTKRKDKNNTSGESMTISASGSFGKSVTFGPSLQVQTIQNETHNVIKKNDSFDFFIGDDEDDYSYTGEVVDEHQQKKVEPLHPRNALPSLPVLPESPTSSHDDYSQTTASTSTTDETSDSFLTKAQSYIRHVELADMVLLAWKLFIAAMAICSIHNSWPKIVRGWNYNNVDSENQNQQYEITMQTNKWIDPLFCALCVVEAFVRTRRVKSEANVNAALDGIETKLTRIYKTTRQSIANFSRKSQLNLHQGGNRRRDTGYDRINSIDELFAKNTLRIWIPVSLVLVSWAVLLPWRNIIRNEYCEDNALGTIWITYCFQKMSEYAAALEEYIKERIALPLLKYMLSWEGLGNEVLQPRRLYGKVQQLLRWVRYIRFAGPLIRMIIKLQDQFWALYNTKIQAWKARAEKNKRLRRRSLLFDDIERIESLVKLQTQLASLPSQIFQFAHEQEEAFRAKVGTLFVQRQEEGRKLRRMLNEMKANIGRSSRYIATSDLYDQINDISQELTSKVSKAILSSHLLPPNTRFGFGWRIVVTICLLIELVRLYLSWKFSESHDMTLTETLTSMMTNCTETVKESGNGPLNFLRSQIENSRKFAMKIIPILGRNIQPAATCTNVPSDLFLSIGRLVESAIDIVCFIDIGVWFFTGELSPENVVVPKPFISRCIVPGTLVQVLDHPTLPEKLPILLMKMLAAAEEFGYSRSIRAGLVLYPVFIILVVDPVKKILFREVDTTKLTPHEQAFVISYNPDHGSPQSLLY